MLDHLIFGSRSGEDDDAVRSLGFVPKRYLPHSVIENQGDNQDRVLIIHSGWGCLLKHLPGGERQILDFALKGDIVGPNLRAGEATESFIALTELAVFEAGTKTLVQGLSGSMRLSLLVLKGIARQKRILMQHLTNIGRRNAAARVAHLMLELGTRLEQAGMASGNRYHCPLTQYDLADALGLTPVHVNRTLRELRERRLLEFQQGIVHLLDPPHLAELAGYEADYLNFDDSP